ncbi:LacI family DNA-binding transcriptional regulator [Ruegeria sp. 2012CJ41-6]|uniref:LacI family DNA-binding transcriptional regulator n=1 Tax=Ruegeria spongiae TaxID=2942209 RepID=A0ABT0Q5K0_9RHOB|nr:LacI family DNA-binding transcriptional regulator [Ruegeria spongiae]MCL6285146.1 LacI family DNA-binding transcriptional regulator [Ruegeria spongiae]
MMADKVTSFDVARLAGVSQSAVSRVFTPGASASAATRDKVTKAAEELGYRPNTLARAMITGKSRVIGVVVAYLENQFYPMALEYLDRALKERGYHILLFMAQNDGNVGQIVEELMSYQVDGIITASVDMSNDIAKRCDDAGIPVVMFNRGQETGTLAQVTSNNIEGGRTVAHFLASGGHRKIAHVSGWQGSSTGLDRMRGFVDGLKDHGVEPVAIEDGRYSQDDAAIIARKLCGTSDRPDAIFVGNDHMAFAVMDCLRFELGLSVPEDVSIVGYDDVPIAAWPAYDLTTIRQPINKMVTATVEILLARIEQGAASERIQIPGPLKIRGSARKPKGFST